MTQWFQFLYSFVGINQTVLYTLIFVFVSLLPIGSIGLLDFVSNSFSFDNAKERITDFGYAAIPLALMGHLAFYWNKLKVTSREFLEITRIYKPERVGNDILIDNKIGGMSALELLFILAGFAGSIYVFCIISKKSKYVLTKSTIAGYFVVFVIFVFAFIYTIAP